MMPRRGLVHLLRNVTVRDLERALLRDGFTISRRSRGSGRLYEHRDGRTALIHYHGGSETLPRRTLASVIQGARWTEEDARRLGLI